MQSMLSLNNTSGQTSLCNAETCSVHGDTIERKNTDDDGVERPAYSLMTGFIGTASITEALSENGSSANA